MTREAFPTHYPAKKSLQNPKTFLNVRTRFVRIYQCNKNNKYDRQQIQQRVLILLLPNTCAHPFADRQLCRFCDWWLADRSGLREEQHADFRSSDWAHHYCCRNGHLQTLNSKITSWKLNANQKMRRENWNWERSDTDAVQQNIASHRRNQQADHDCTDPKWLHLK